MITTRLITGATLVATILWSTSPWAQEISRPSASETTEIFLNASQVEPDGSGKEIQYYLKGPSWLDSPRRIEIAYEYGRWLPESPDALLVIVNALETAHAGGMYHQFFAIMNPKTHTLLTPVFHYRADEAVRAIIRGTERDSLLYAGGEGGQGYYKDLSTLFTFHVGRVDVLPVLGKLNPERFRVRLEKGFIVLKSCHSGGGLMETCEEGNDGYFSFNEKNSTFEVTKHRPKEELLP